MVVTEFDYKVAQQGDAKVRQEFLAELDLEDLGELVKDVIYHPINHASQFREYSGESINMCMGCAPGLRLNSKIFRYLPFKFRSSIFVLPTAFNYSHREFISMLIDHEGHHARQVFGIGGKKFAFYKNAIEHPDEAVRDYFASLFDIPAYINQLANCKKRNMDASEFASIKDRLEFFIGKFVEGSIEGLESNQGKRDLSIVLCESPYDDNVRTSFEL